MMRQIFSFSFLCLFLLHLTLPPHQIAAGAIHDSIKETCKECAERSPKLNYDFCVTALQVVPGSRYSNAQGLGIISLKLAQTNATHTISFIKKLLKNGDYDLRAKQPLEDCLELYSDAIPTLVKSIAEFPSVNILVSSLMTASTTCDDGFDEEAEVNSPLKKQNYDFYQLCDIALVITNLVSLLPLSFSFEARAATRDLTL